MAAYEEFRKLEGSKSPWHLLQVPVFWFLMLVLTSLYSALIPVALLPRRWPLRLLKSYLAAMFFLMRTVLGVTWHVSGSLAASSGPVLLAVKHQSALETLLLQYILEDPVIVLKQELLTTPVIGWILRRLGHIGVDRNRGLDAAKALCSAALNAHMQGRPIVIFPEGTRRAVGSPPQYKSGVSLLYMLLKCPCVPVAVNSGQLLKPTSISPRPGAITLEFLAAIEPGLPRLAFMERLQSEIEAATEALHQP